MTAVYYNDTSCIIALLLIAVLTAFVAGWLLCLWKFMRPCKDAGRFSQLIIGVGESTPQEGTTVEVELTSGAQRILHFGPLNRFGKPSFWDQDNPVAVIASSGPATMELSSVKIDGTPVGEKEVGEYWTLKSNLGLEGSAFTLKGDGHNEAPGEEESIKEILIQVVVIAKPADVESVTEEAGPETEQV